MSILLQGAYAIAIGGLLWAGAALIGRLLRDRGRPERGVWVTALGLAVVLPFVLPHLGVGTFVSPGAVTGSVGGITVLDLAPGVLTVSGAPLFAGLSVLLLSVWAAASFLLAARFLSSLRAVERIRSRAQPMDDPSGRILVTERHGPAVVGFARPVVLVPGWIRTLSISRRRWVLRHEFEHIRGRDPWLLAVIVVSRVLVPWNPVVWRLGSRLRATIETDCDRRTVGRDRRRVREYGEALLALAGGPGFESASLPGIASTFAEPRLPLDDRIRALTTRPRRIGGVVGVAIAGVVALVFAAACEMPTPSTRDATSDAVVPAATTSAEPVYEDIPVESLVKDESGQRATSDPAITPYDVPPVPQNSRELQRTLEETYPPLLKDAGIGGTVIVWFYIDTEGRVQDAELYQSSGYDALDAAALEVAATYEFSPAYNRDKKVPVWVQIPITFN